MRVRLSLRATQDLSDGYDFYENQGEGVGAYFVESLLDEIESLAYKAGIHPIRYRNYHEYLSNRFPFAIYYRLVDDVVSVDAVVDCRRNPAWIKKRLN